MSKEVNKKEQLTKARHIADTYARSMGKNSIEEIINPIREGLNSNDVAQVDISRELARGTVEQLTKLILKQEIFTTPTAEYINFIDVFYDGVVNEGNGKLYDFNNPTGSDSYVANEFVATGFTTKDVDEFQIKMYDTGKNLSAQGYQFRKPEVYTPSEWIPYFKNGNLTGFIEQVQANINKTWKLFIFDKIVRKITSATPKKTISGTAANAFDAWSQEILPEIRKMTTYSTDYNANSTNTALMQTEPEDLLIFANPKTIQTLQSGIKSQLFNAQFLDIEGLIKANNFVDCGRELNIGNTNSKISTRSNYYIDENTVIVISKKALRHFTQIEAVETQHYGRNMSMEIVMHKWGALDILPWGQMFKYTNANLNRLP